MSGIKSLFALVLLAAGFAVLPVWAAEGTGGAAESEPDATAFATVIDDLPLMPGLALVTDEDVLFTARAGRIAQTVAAGPVDVDSVYAFYQKTLPQLGWKATDARTFEREKETLRIDATSVTRDASTLVRFSLHPIAAR